MRMDISISEIYFASYEKNGKRIPIKRPLGEHEKYLSDIWIESIAPRASAERSRKGYASSTAGGLIYTCGRDEFNGL